MIWLLLTIVRIYKLYMYILIYLQKNTASYCTKTTEHIHPARNEAAEANVDILWVSHAEQWEAGLNSTENVNMAGQRMLSTFRLTARQFSLHLANSHLATHKVHACIQLLNGTSELLFSLVTLLQILSLG